MSTPTAPLARAPAGRTRSSLRCENGWTDDIYRASRRAAELVQSALVASLGFPDRGIQERSDFTGFNWADVPVVLVELGFMTNPTEDRQLARPAVRQRAAAGLCRGTLRWLGLAPRRCEI